MGIPDFSTRNLFKSTKIEIPGPRPWGPKSLFRAAQESPPESLKSPQELPKSPLRILEFRRKSPNLGKAFGPTKTEMLPQDPRNIRIPRFRQRSPNLGKAFGPTKTKMLPQILRNIRIPKFRQRSPNLGKASGPTKECIDPIRNA